MNPVIVTEGSVQGNITSCKIETVPISFILEPFSPIKATTYRTYNVCTGEKIAEYVAYQPSGFVGLYMFLALIVVAIIITYFSESNL